MKVTGITHTKTSFEKNSFATSRLHLVMEGTPGGGNETVRAELYSPSDQNVFGQIMRIAHRQPTVILPFLKTGNEVWMEESFYNKDSEFENIPKLEPQSLLNHLDWWEQIPLANNPAEEKLDDIQVHYKTPGGCGIVEAFILGKIPFSLPPNIDSDENYSSIPETHAVIYGRVQPNLKKSYCQQINISLHGKEFKVMAQRKPYPLLPEHEKTKIPTTDPKVLEQTIRESLEWGYSPATGKKPAKLKVAAGLALMGLKPPTNKESDQKKWRELIPNKVLELMLDQGCCLNIQDILKTGLPLLPKVLKNLPGNYYNPDAEYTSLFNPKANPELPGENAALQEYIHKFGIESLTKPLLEMEPQDAALAILRMEFAGVFPAAARNKELAGILVERWVKRTGSLLPPKIEKTLPLHRSRRSKDQEEALRILLVPWLGLIKRTKTPGAPQLLEKLQTLAAEKI